MNFLTSTTKNKQTKFWKHLARGNDFESQKTWVQNNYCIPFSHICSMKTIFYTHTTWFKTKIKEIFKHQPNSRPLLFWPKVTKKRKWNKRRNKKGLKTTIQKTLSETWQQKTVLSKQPNSKMQVDYDPEEEKKQNFRFNHKTSQFFNYCFW